jgi:histidinol-phosphate aminotransferase
VDPRLNLSSNELIHPDAVELLSTISSRLSSDLWYRYPAATDTAARISAYLGCHPDELAMTPGSDSALRLVCQYFARSTGGRGTVLLQDPNYVAWEQEARLLGLRVHRVSLDDGGPDEQARRLVDIAAVTRGQLIAVSVPNAPAGGSLPAHIVDELAALARENDHLLVIDSAYQVFQGSVTEQVARRSERVVVVQTLSKSHGLAGARMAVLCTEPTLLAAIAPQSLEHCVSAPAMLAARIAVDHHDRFAAIWQEIAEVREHAMTALPEGISVPWPSGGNFLTVRVGSSDDAATTVAALSVAGVRVRDLSALPGLAGCLRFTVADRATTAGFLSLLADVRSRELRGVSR